MKHALSGLRHVFSHEKNFRIQVLAASIAVFCMFAFPLRWSERVIVLLLIAGVLILEIVNSAVEHLVDVVTPRLSPQVKLVKDMMAAAVLCMSFAAFLIGIVLFLPYILELALAS